MVPIEAIHPSAATQAITCVCQTEPRFMTVEVAAMLLDMSRDYLYVAAKKGLLPVKRVGRRIKLYRAFILDFIDAPAGTQFEEYAAEWMAREAETAVGA